MYYDEADGTRRLQTRPGDGFNCGTSKLIDAPNHIVVPEDGRGVWGAIWVNYEVRKEQAREQAAREFDRNAGEGESDVGADVGHQAPTTEESH